MEMLVGQEPVGGGGTTTESPPPTNREKFLTSCDEAGRPLFEALLKLAETHDLRVNWGFKGFSLRADFGNIGVIILQGYPPQAWFGESLYTGFGDVTKKVKDGSTLVEELRQKLMDTGAFVRAGQKHGDLKWVGSSLTDDTIEKIVLIFAEFASQVKQQGLSE